MAETAQDVDHLLRTLDAAIDAFDTDAADAAKTGERWPHDPNVETDVPIWAIRLAATEIRRLSAREAELEEGLRPFAATAAEIAAGHPDWDHDDFVFCEWEPWAGEPVRLTLGPFRAAARLLQQEGT